MQVIGRQLAAALLLAVGLVSVVAAGLGGAPAPDFVLKGVSGRNYRLSEYRGQVVLLSFGASWCGDCRSQLEELGVLYERYAGAGLEMLAISLDRDLDDVEDTARHLGTGFPTLHDAGGATAELYQINRMPYVVLIDRDGVVRDEFTGFSKGEGSRYLDEARALLAE
jgi:peroxiredoxin